MSENITPSKLSLLCSFTISAILFFVLLFAGITYYKIAIICLIILVSTYLVILSLVQKLFSERIKLIYRFISTTKDNYRQQAFRQVVLPKPDLKGLEKDVQSWATEQEAREKQIALIHQNETYRKEFLANFGHEIKTPIFSVQGYLHTLIDGAINDEAVRDKFLNNAKKAIDRLALLTNDLDTISNIESGGLQLHFEKLNIIELIIDVIDELAFAIQPKNISLKLLNPSNSVINVYADKQRMRQVLINIIENAVKFGNTNGFVNVTVFEIDNKNILVEISDNGIGMQANELDRVFERFYRTDSGKIKNKKGSGIGLALVKHIIEAHHQKISCRSTPNVGTTFGFTLPCDDIY